MLEPKEPWSSQALLYGNATELCRLQTRRISTYMGSAHVEPGEGIQRHPQLPISRAPARALNHTSAFRFRTHGVHQIWCQGAVLSFPKVWAMTIENGARPRVKTQNGHKYGGVCAVTATPQQYRQAVNQDVAHGLSKASKRLQRYSQGTRPPQSNKANALRSMTRNRVPNKSVPGQKLFTGSRPSTTSTQPSRCMPTPAELPRNCGSTPRSTSCALTSNWAALHGESLRSTSERTAEKTRSSGRSSLPCVVSAIQKLITIGFNNKWIVFTFVSKDTDFYQATPVSNGSES